MKSKKLNTHVVEISSIIVTIIAHSQRNTDDGMFGSKIFELSHSSVFFIIGIIDSIDEFKVNHHLRQIIRLAELTLLDREASEDLPAVSVFAYLQESFHI